MMDTGKIIRHMGMVNSILIMGRSILGTGWRIRRRGTGFIRIEMGIRIKASGCRIVRMGKARKPCKMAPNIRDSSRMG